MPFLAFVKRASANPSSPMYSMMSVSLNQLKGLVENYAKLKICIIYFFFSKVPECWHGPSIFYKEIALHFFCWFTLRFREKM